MNFERFIHEIENLCIFFSKWKGLFNTGSGFDSGTRKNNTFRKEKKEDFFMKTKYIYLS